MKIDTKKCTPIDRSNPTVLVNPNKNIVGRDQMPSSSAQKNEDPADNQSEGEEEAGRALRFLAQVILSPVLRTARIMKQNEDPVEKKEKKEKTTRECVLTEDGVDELTKLLSGTKISSDTESESDSEGESDEPKTDETLGRVDKTVFSYRDCKSYSVRRSTRVAKKYY